MYEIRVINVEITGAYVLEGILKYLSILLLYLEGERKNCLKSRFYTGIFRW